jgi:hypothetical protein
MEVASTRVAAGHGPRLIMADANHNCSDIKEFEGGIMACFLTALFGAATAQTYSSP